MRRGLKSTVPFSATSAGSTSLIAPMRRGLKYQEMEALDRLARHFTHCPDEEGTEISTARGYPSSSSGATSLIAPMRRGLKCARISARRLLVCTIRTSLIAPMRRGLKSNRWLWPVDNGHRHFTHCPDEEGTEIQATISHSTRGRQNENIIDPRSVVALAAAGRGAVAESEPRLYHHHPGTTADLCEPKWSGWLYGHHSRLSAHIRQSDPDGLDYSDAGQAADLDPRGSAVHSRSGVYPETGC